MYVYDPPPDLRSPGARKWARRTAFCRARGVCPYCPSGREQPAAHGDRCVTCYAVHKARQAPAMRAYRARRARGA